MMTIYPRCLGRFVALCLLLLSCPSVFAASGWRVFRNARDGYSVEIPRAWRLAESGTRFVLHSFPASEAVRPGVIPRDGASILISTASEFLLRGEAPPSGLEDWVLVGTRGRTIVLKRRFEIGTRDGPRAVIEVGTRVHTPGLSLKVTEWYFVLDGRFLVVALQRWPNESRAREFVGVFERVASGVQVLRRR